MRLSLLLVATAAFAAPRIDKVEPPNWWAGHSINPVRLLIRGAELGGADVRTTSKGFRVRSVKVNEAGTYAFADVTIPKNAMPGPVDLTLATAGGEAKLPFEILKPLDRAGRFRGFSQDDVIYLLMPDRFANGDLSNDDPEVSKGLFDPKQPRYYHGGDLQGVIDKLPYLKELGVTAIWLNPIYDNVNRLNTRETYDGKAITDYHGYGAVDFYAVDEHFGTIDKFRELVDKAHSAGIKIVQDQVANHTGPFHPWATSSPTPTWYNGTVAKHLANTWQTWTLMDPYSQTNMRRATLDGWFIDILPDLNQDDPEVARYLIQNTLWWIGVSGMDGIRQDTLPYVPRTFWSEWMKAIHREYPAFRVVGEMFDGDPALVSFFQGGVARFDGVDSHVDGLFDFPMFFPLRRAFAGGGNVREVANMLGRDYLYPNPDMLVTFLGLHDVHRFMNEGGATIDGLKLAFTFLLTTRGIPMIYYGDEIAMRGGNDPDNRRDYVWGVRNADEQSVLDHVRKLGQLRAANDCLRRGKLTHVAAGEQYYVYRRTGGSCSAVVAINNDVKPAHILVEMDGAADLKDALGGPSARLAEGQLTADLPPRSAAIYFVPSR